MCCQWQPVAANATTSSLISTHMLYTIPKLTPSSSGDSGLQYGGGNGDAHATGITFSYKNLKHCEAGACV